MSNGNVCNFYEPGQVRHIGSLRLKYLNIGNAMVHPDSVFSGTIICSTLEELEMVKSHVSGGTLQSLGNLQTLKRLNMSGIKYRGSDPAAFNFLELMPLTALDISCNGAVNYRLVQRILRNRCLVMLTLNECKNVDMRCIASMQNHPHLRVASVTGTNISGLVSINSKTQGRPFFI
jgi:hypothetical protein